MKIIRRSPETIARHADREAEAARAAVREARRAAYGAEADPLAFKVLRGEAEMETYTAKIAEIRDRHPYPEEKH